MARAMNLAKRVTGGKKIVAKTLKQANNAKKMADELMASFKGNLTLHGKKARDYSRALTRLSAALTRVHKGFEKVI